MNPWIGAKETLDWNEYIGQTRMAETLLVLDFMNPCIFNLRNSRLGMHTYTKRNQELIRLHGFKQEGKKNLRFEMNT